MELLKQRENKPTKRYYPVIKCSRSLVEMVFPPETVLFLTLFLRTNVMHKQPSFRDFYCEFDEKQRESAKNARKKPSGIHKNNIYIVANCVTLSVLPTNLMSVVRMWRRWRKQKKKKKNTKRKQSTQSLHLAQKMHPILPRLPCCELNAEKASRLNLVLITSY